MTLVVIAVSGLAVQCTYLVSSPCEGSVEKFFHAGPGTSVLILVKKVFAVAALGDVNLQASWPARVAPLWVWLDHTVPDRCPHCCFRASARSCAVRAPRVRRRRLGTCNVGMYAAAAGSWTSFPRRRQSILRSRHCIAIPACHPLRRSNADASSACAFRGRAAGGRRNVRLPPPERGPVEWTRSSRASNSPTRIVRCRSRPAGPL